MSNLILILIHVPPKADVHLDLFTGLFRQDPPLLTTGCSVLEVLAQCENCSWYLHACLFVAHTLSLPVVLTRLDSDIHRYIKRLFRRFFLARQYSRVSVLRTSIKDSDSEILILV